MRRKDGFVVFLLQIAFGALGALLRLPRGLLLGLVLFLLGLVLLELVHPSSHSSGQCASSPAVTQPSAARPRVVR